MDRPIGRSDANDSSDDKKVATSQFQFRRRDGGGGGIAPIDPWDSIAPIRGINADRSIDPSFDADFSAGVPSDMYDMLTIVGAPFRGDR